MSRGRFALVVLAVALTVVIVSVGVSPLESSGGASPPVQAILQPLGGIASATITFNPRIAHPVVVGQDPDRRGADIYVTAISCPEQYTFWEIEFIRVFCCGGWIVVPVLRENTISVPDPIDLRPGRWSFEARLTSKSRQWIKGELNRRHPGARIVHPDWDLTRTRHFRIVQSGYMMNMCYKVVMEATKVPFVDPGVYRVEASFVTTGTHFRPPPGHIVIIPPPRLFTPPKHFGDVKRLRVWMLDESLVR